MFLHCTSCVTIFVCVTSPTFVYLIFRLNLYYWIRLPKLTDHSNLGLFFFLAESIVCLFNFASVSCIFHLWVTCQLLACLPVSMHLSFNALCSANWSFKTVHPNNVAEGFLVNASTGIFLLSVQPSTEMLKECGKYAKSSDRIICSSGCFPTLCSAVVLERKSSKTSFLHWLLLTSIDVITVAVHRHYVSAYMSKLVSYWRTKKYNERYCFVCLLFLKKKKIISINIHFARQTNR